MLLNPKQLRNFKLTLLLAPGKPISKVRIIRELNCSGPTLTRALRNLRDLYCADIRFSKMGNTYQLVDKGMLTKKDVKRIEELLAQHLSFKSEASISHVFLDKEKKKSISVSLRMSVLRKIDGLANRLETSRSEVVEMVVDQCIETLLQENINGNISKR
ncbi:Tellurium resistance protein terW [Xenorhabdus poinarii G6]|uniref:Tellurium resistance protein terW n=1 Tax=Xenorhabdus poinarii G6 TaxID=1354304 RepID=A0A068QZX6_9GAMM|nr:hypothetical protein [Xenorhabdus poinarii]CDG20206.1 Tellurium resistance protein terW [Xenorhabdus poinarii G6]